MTRKETAMRALAALMPLAMLAAPAAAAEPQSDSDFSIPAEMTDPTRVMMDMPVGELQAAVAGRQPTAADKQRTVRDLAGHDPDFERKVETGVAQAVPRMQASMKSMAASLPAMMRVLEKAADEMEGSIDRATANLPQPGYPKR
jgi:hypothetical protein